MRTVIKVGPYPGSNNLRISQNSSNVCFLWNKPHQYQIALNLSKVRKANYFSLISESFKRRLFSFNPLKGKKKQSKMLLFSISIASGPWKFGEHERSATSSCGSNNIEILEASFQETERIIFALFCVYDTEPLLTKYLMMPFFYGISFHKRTL